MSKHFTHTRLTKLFSTTFVVRVIGAGLGLVSQIILARMLGVNNYGIYVYVLTWMNFLLPISSLGFEVTSLRYLAAYFAEKEWSLARGFIRKSSHLVLAISVSVSILTALFMKMYAHPQNDNLKYSFWVMCALLPVTAMLRLECSKLQGIKRVVVSQSMFQIVRPTLLIVSVMIVFGLDLTKANSLTAMYVNLIVTVVTLVIAVYIVYNNLPLEIVEFKPTYHLTEWLHVTATLTVTTMFSMILSQIDVLLVGLLSSTTDAGVYSAASKIITVVLFGLGSTNVVIAPLISEYYATGQKEDLQKLLSLTAKWVFILSAGLTILIVLFGRQLLGLFGSSFEQGYSILVILSIGQIVNALAGPTGYFMSMTGHHKMQATVMGILSLLSIILNLIMIPIWGAIGAAIATATANIVWNVCFVFYIYQRETINLTILPLKHIIPVTGHLPNH